MSGYFTMTPTIIDNDARTHPGGGGAASITFEAGHTDDRDRPCFDVLVRVNGERVAMLALHYDAATELVKALKGAMRGDT